MEIVDKITFTIQIFCSQAPCTRFRHMPPESGAFCKSIGLYGMNKCKTLRNAPALTRSIIG